MSVIRSHDVTLYGGTDEFDVVLRPLCDAHLPLLYKWNADPEVLYWADGGDKQAHSEETVRGIYGKTSQSPQNFLFLVEANGVPVGECWLEKMNLRLILDMYPPAADVRRIDMMLGEKTYWNRGIGTAMIGMLVDFAFNREHTEVLCSPVYDYNLRSRRAFEKNGFTLALRVQPSTEAPTKAGEDMYYRLTREEYAERRGKIPGTS